MTGAMIFGLISGALSAFQSFSQAQAQISQAQNQARVMAANAQVTRQNAAMQARQKEEEARVQDREKSRLRRDFQELQAANATSLASGNVDLSSGSALDVSLGNIQNFSVDMADNAYAVAMKKWEAREQLRLANQSANIMEKNASWLRKSSGNAATSLLSATISGAGGFAQGYSLAGGSLGKLFGFKK